MPLSFDPLLPHLPTWALVLFRLTGIFVFAPMLGSKVIPAQIKVFWALGLSLCIYPMLLGPGRASAGLIEPMIQSGFSLWTLPGAIGSELLIGLIIGYGASIPMMALQVAGHVADQQMGLGIAEIYNPDMEENSGVVGQFFFMLALAIFLIVGGHRAMIGTLVGSFDRIPLGGFLPDGGLLDLILAMVSAMFELAMRVSAPLLCLVFLETIAMGFVARTVPQLNILSIGFALRILIGTGLLIASLAMESDVYLGMLRRTLRQLEMFFGP